MLVTKDLDNKVFDYIYPWGETLASIAWTISVDGTLSLLVNLASLSGVVKIFIFVKLILFQ